MILTVSGKEALIPALLCYIDSPDDFETRYGIIGSSFSKDISYGVSPSKAQDLVEQLSLGNLLIDDNCIEDILSIILTYKAVINFELNDPSSSNEDIFLAKSQRRSLNALIRYIKGYCAENNILLPDDLEYQPTSF